MPQMVPLIPLLEFSIRSVLEKVANKRPTKKRGEEEEEKGKKKKLNVDCSL
ncbi:hypothetical protein MTR_2g061620 [Medicago truncatula]|uniref:Uncharacterized protein n=1 Tax=Medicago truncatula TaxID=3880 RepID=A0A072V955_MEDTR|nr:hypothetical protein MTR_2g061620 [Medicago truncatula]